jgi:hypothetical protein
MIISARDWRRAGSTVSVEGWETGLEGGWWVPKRPLMKAMTALSESFMRVLKTRSKSWKVSRWFKGLPAWWKDLPLVWGTFPEIKPVGLIFI